MKVKFWISAKLVVPWFIEIGKQLHYENYFLAFIITIAPPLAIALVIDTVKRFIYKATHPYR